MAGPGPLDPQKVVRIHSPELKKRAFSLSQSGRSLLGISQELGISKSTASLWTRGLGPRLPPNWKLGVQGRIRRAERDKFEAYAEADSIWASKKEDSRFLFRLALYVGEGSKTGSSARLTNCDPRVIRNAISFFESLGVPREKMRIQLNVHTEDQVSPAKTFWLRESGLAATQFLKTQVRSPSVKGGRFHKQPYGTCQVRAQGRRLASIVERLSNLALA